MPEIDYEDDSLPGLLDDSDSDDDSIPGLKVDSDSDGDTDDALLGDREWILQTVRFKVRLFVNQLLTQQHIH